MRAFKVLKARTARPTHIGYSPLSIANRLFAAFKQHEALSKYLAHEKRENIQLGVKEIG